MNIRELLIYSMMIALFSDGIGLVMLGIRLNWIRMIVISVIQILSCAGLTIIMPSLLERPFNISENHNLGVLFGVLLSAPLLMIIYLIVYRKDKRMIAQANKIDPGFSLLQIISGLLKHNRKVNAASDLNPFFSLSLILAIFLPVFIQSLSVNFSKLGIWSFSLACGISIAYTGIFRSRLPMFGCIGLRSSVPLQYASYTVIMLMIIGLLSFLV
ncbi:MAG: hypothetical protein ACYC27_10215 [Armatimonadota bacterium]